MSDEFDGPWKEAIDDALASCLALLFPDVHAGIDWSRDHQPLDQELQRPEPDADEGVRRADKLFQAFRPDSGDPRYLVLECQMSRDARFGERLTDYWFRIRSKYGLPPALLVIYGDDDPSWKPQRHREGEAGTLMTLEFRPVKLVEWAGRREELEAGDNVFGLFVAAHLEALATRKDDARRAAAKVRILRNLAGRGMTPIEQGRWFRLFDWLMKLPRDRNLEVKRELAADKEIEMPYVTSWEEIARDEGMEKGLAEGLEKGLQEGRQKGLQQGLQQGTLMASRQNLLAFLRARFPADTDSLADAINAIDDQARLDGLIPLAATAVTFDDFRGRFATA